MLFCFAYILPCTCAAPSWLCLLLIPRNAILKLDALTAENVQRASNRQIHLAPAQLLDQLQIRNRPAPARICHRDAAPLGQPRNQLVIDAALQALDVGGVDQELGAIRLKQRNAVCVVSVGACILVACGAPLFSSKSVMVCHLFVATNHRSSRRRHDRSITSLSLLLSSAASTRCRRAMLNSESGNRYDVMMTYCARLGSCKPGAVLGGCATHFVGAVRDPGCGVGVVDAAADLHSAGPGGEGGAGCGVVAWAQHDDMGA